MPCIMVAIGASHLSCNFKNCLSFGNYTNELISFTNELNKLGFTRENQRNWIQTRFQQKHPFILDISKKKTNSDFPKKYICMIQNYKE
jgi:hypothetical protein